MMPRPTMPSGFQHVRTTPEFTDATVPRGLLGAHQVADGVWGRLVVLSGTVRFVFETEPPTAHEIGAGASIDIPPSVRHHIEPARDSRFAVEFHAAPPAA